MRAAFRERYGPWVVIAGASEGLGEAFATALAARGLSLVLLARRADALRSVADRLTTQHGVEVRAVTTDLADPELGTALRYATVGLDVGLVVYNAAYSYTDPLLAASLDDALRVVDVNIRGPLILAHTFVPAMIKRRKGGLVLMSSLVGITGSPNLAAYAASKSFNNTLGQSLASEIASSGVDVLVTCAGAIRTPNYLRIATKDAPGTLDPLDVVEQSLAALGKKTLLVPGAVNRVAATALGRVLPRKLTLNIVGRSTRDSLEGMQ